MLDTELPDTPVTVVAQVLSAFLGMFRKCLDQVLFFRGHRHASLRLDIVQSNDGRLVELLTHLGIAVLMPFLIVDLGIALCNSDDVSKVNACHISFPKELNTAEIVPDFEAADFLELGESHTVKSCHLRGYLVAGLGCLRQLVGLGHDLSGFSDLLGLLSLLCLRLVDLCAVVLRVEDLDVDLGVFDDFCLLEGLA